MECLQKLRKKIIPLTDKEKRFIRSPSSFSSSKDRRRWRFRTRKKIKQIQDDVKFLKENSENVSKIILIEDIDQDDQATKDTQTGGLTQNDKDEDDDFL